MILICSGRSRYRDGAMELVHIGQAVPDLGGRLDYFLRTAFNHPTWAECYKVVALDAHNELATASCLRKEAT